MSGGFRIDGHFIPISYDKNNDRKLQLSELSIFCNENGLVYDTESKKIFNIDEIVQQENSPTTIAQNIYSAVSNRNSLGLSTTDIEKLKLNIGRITPENVFEVMQKYSDSFNENIIDAIMNEFGLDMNIRVRCINKIKNALLDVYREQGVYVDDISSMFDNELRLQNNKLDFASADYLNVFLDTLQRRARASRDQDNTATNGEIDSNFKQGSTGDCWLLSSIIAINNTPKGREILNDLLTVNEDGSVSVHLKGPNKTYVVTQEELQNNIQYSTGDLDVRAIEIAVNKYFYDERGYNQKLDINSNYAFIAYEILLGKTIDESDYIEVTREYLEQRPSVSNFAKPGMRLLIGHSITDEHIDRLNENTIVTVSSPQTEDLTVELSNGESLTLIDHHGYAVIGVDSENVYLKNPHDTSKTLSVPRETFKAFFAPWQEITL